ncbi:hypothetical protein SAMN05421663_11523 [Terribacillus halophilus]|uniref:Uncharacterized protein n=1 Tax=Terribacillus halophilus TaxID=361279 RepID=A0A1G6W6W8_9BACI|nr:hypothetical protein SAMN05421663_11523 [Terribacillus halophilus]
MMSQQPVCQDTVLNPKGIRLKDKKLIRSSLNLLPFWGEGSFFQEKGEKQYGK